MAKGRLQTHRDRENMLEQLRQNLANAADIFSSEEVGEVNIKLKGAIQAHIAVLI